MRRPNCNPSPGSGGKRPDPSQQSWLSQRVVHFRAYIQPPGRRSGGDAGNPGALYQPVQMNIWLPDALFRLTEGTPMTEIKEHMEIIGADGVHVGTVDKVEGNRIKLTKKDSGEGSHKGHHHFIAAGLVTGIDGGKVRLSANGDVAVTMEQEKAG